MKSQRILKSFKTQKGRKLRFLLPLDFSYFMEIQPKREVHINYYHHGMNVASFQIFQQSGVYKISYLTSQIKIVYHVLI